LGRDEDTYFAKLKTVKLSELALDQKYVTRGNEIHFCHRQVSHIEIDHTDRQLCNWVNVHSIHKPRP
jgi:hypothetical protein